MIAILLGDAIMYILGRATGWWLLGILCRFTPNPETCILSTADRFYRRGRIVLLFAKFVPGINALAAPMAGSMRMPFAKFFVFDMAGALIYILSYFGVGYIFSDFLGAITRGYTQFGTYVTWVVAVVVAVYAAYRLFLAIREKKKTPIDKVTARDVADQMKKVVVYDVRSHGYYEKNARRILGSARLEPHVLNQPVAPPMPKDRRIVLYCTCVREATSVKVARILKQQGYDVSVIAGGLRAWRKAGLPLEPVPKDEMVQLPTFSQEK
jgi:membrane protein DedA with SNARE-associated domain/rhodanese-related sulfurtransferase